jgi:hypothetical protein
VGYLNILKMFVDNKEYVKRFIMIKIPYKISKQLTKWQRILLTNENKKMLNNINRNYNFVPIFIIAPPRSGSTLSYQLIGNSLQTCYFSNVANVMYMCPLTVSKLLKPLGINNPPKNFESYHGVTSAWNEPSTALNIWGRWFKKDQTFEYTPLREHQAILSLRGTIYGMQNIFSKPFIGKWQGFNSNLESLNHVFPDCLFIRITREYTSIIKSMLKARESLGSRYDWFSSCTSAYDEIQEKTQDPIAQIYLQISQCDDDLDTFIGRISRSRVLTFDYMDICKNPIDFINKIIDSYFKLTGVSIHHRNIKKIPKKFRASYGKKLSFQDEKKIKELLTPQRNVEK